MKNLIKLISITTVVFGLFVFATSNINAQSCTGTVECCSSSDYQYTCDSCSPACTDPPCSCCGWECVGDTYDAGCTLFDPNNPNSCGPPFSICHNAVGGSCSSGGVPPPPTNTPGPGSPTNTPAPPVCANNWYRCSGNIPLGPYSSQGACESDGACSGCCRCGSPPCGWSTDAKKTFQVFDDKNGDGVWYPWGVDGVLGTADDEKRISSDPTCTSGHTRLDDVAGDFYFRIDGSSFNPFGSNCDVDNSEVRSKGCGSFGLDDYNHTNGTCFGEKCGEEGDACDSFPPYCESTSPYHLKVGPFFTRTAGEPETRFVELNIPAGWECSPGNDCARWILWEKEANYSGSCKSPVEFFGVQQNICEIDIQPVAGDVGDTINVGFSTLPNDPSQFNNITFNIADASIADFDPDPAVDQSFYAYPGGVYNFNMYGNYPGTTSYQAVAVKNNGTICQDTEFIDINNPAAWYQVYGGSIWANGGNINSRIPDSSILGYTAYLLNILERPAGNEIAMAGVAAASGNIINDPVSDPSSTGNSRAESITSKNIGKYNYNYFYDKLGSPTQNIGSTPKVDDLENCSEFRNGYLLCYRNGPVRIDYGDSSIGNSKIILLANGDVRINTMITLNDSKGFLMIIADGDIVIDPGFGNLDPTLTTPNLEGIFIALDDFVTEADPSGSDLHLRIRGSVTGLNINTDDGGVDDNGVALNRTLPDNSQGPAETFELSPNLILRFPRFLSEKQVLWREVSP